MIRYLLSAITGYILGSLSFGIIVSKLKYKKDIRDYGSNNAGMTNTARTFGKKAAAVVFIGDFLKPILACIIAVFLISDGTDKASFGYIAGTSAILGHIFPMFFQFRGGKGVASMFGVSALMCPASIPILAVVFFLTLTVSKTVSLSSMISAVFVPIVTFIIYKYFDFLIPTVFSGNWLIPTVCTALTSVTVIFMHRSNIGRLLRGEERKIGKNK